MCGEDKQLAKWEKIENRVTSKPTSEKCIIELRSLAMGFNQRLRIGDDLVHVDWEALGVHPENIKEDCCQVVGSVDYYAAPLPCNDIHEGKITSIFYKSPTGTGKTRVMGDAWLELDRLDHSRHAEKLIDICPSSKQKFSKNKQE